MPSSQYTSAYPPTPFSSEYKAFFESFYAISDTPGAHDTYVSQFTPNATLIMASKKVQGHDAILALRKGMWEKVASRSHFPRQVFPYGESSDEVMLYGTVDYKLKDGGTDSKEWAARAKLVRDGAEVRMSFYQVYLDTASAVK